MEFFFSIFVLYFLYHIFNSKIIVLNHSKHVVFSVPFRIPVGEHRNYGNSTVKKRTVVVIFCWCGTGFAMFDRLQCSCTTVISTIDALLTPHVASIIHNHGRWLTMIAGEKWHGLKITYFHDCYSTIYSPLRSESSPAGAGAATKRT